ncbi:MAG: toxin-antitoxin system antitoxin subunit [Candidatus Hodarchaeota archaeon]
MGKTKLVSIIIRNVPESIRAQLKSKAALEGKSMQGLILELITRYVSK